MLYVIRSTFQNINLNIPLNTNTIIMKSPITGKEMFLKREHRNLIFRKEEYDIVYHYFLCEDTKEQFTIDELDELNLTQLYNKYRESHNLPFPDEIIETRQKYKLSATKMSEILGFGINWLQIQHNLKNYYLKAVSPRRKRLRNILLILMS